MSDELVLKAVAAITRQYLEGAITADEAMTAIVGLMEEGR